MYVELFSLSVSCDLRRISLENLAKSVSRVIRIKRTIGELYEKLRNEYRTKNENK